MLHIEANKTVFDLSSRARVIICVLLALEFYQNRDLTEFREFLRHMAFERWAAFRRIASSRF